MAVKTQRLKDAWDAEARVQHVKGLLATCGVASELTLQSKPVLKEDLQALHSDVLAFKREWPVIQTAIRSSREGAANRAKNDIDKNYRKYCATNPDRLKEKQLVEYLDSTYKANSQLVQYTKTHPEVLKLPNIAQLFTIYRLASEGELTAKDNEKINFTEFKTKLRNQLKEIYGDKEYLEYSMLFDLIDGLVKYQHGIDEPTLGRQLAGTDESRPKQIKKTWDTINAFIQGNVPVETYADFLREFELLQEETKKGELYDILTKATAHIATHKLNGKPTHIVRGEKIQAKTELRDQLLARVDSKNKAFLLKQQEYIDKISEAMEQLIKKIDSLLVLENPSPLDYQTLGTYLEVLNEEAAELGKYIDVQRKATIEIRIEAIQLKAKALLSQQVGVLKDEAVVEVLETLHAKEDDFKQQFSPPKEKLAELAKAQDGLVKLSRETSNDPGKILLYDFLAKLSEYNLKKNKGRRRPWFLGGTLKARHKQTADLQELFLKVISGKRTAQELLLHLFQLEAQIKKEFRGNKSRLLAMVMDMQIRLQKINFDSMQNLDMKDIKDIIAALDKGATFAQLFGNNTKTLLDNIAGNLHVPQILALEELILVKNEHTPEQKQPIATAYFIFKLAHSNSLPMSVADYIKHHNIAKQVREKMPEITRTINEQPIDTLLGNTNIIAFYAWLKENNPEQAQTFIREINNKFITYFRKTIKDQSKEDVVDFLQQPLVSGLRIDKEYQNELHKEIKTFVNRYIQKLLEADNQAELTRLTEQGYMIEVYGQKYGTPEQITEYQEAFLAAEIEKIEAELAQLRAEPQTKKESQLEPQAAKYVTEDASVIFGDTPLTPIEILTDEDVCKSLAKINAICIKLKEGRKPGKPEGAVQIMAEIASDKEPVEKLEAILKILTKKLDPKRRNWLQQTKDKVSRAEETTQAYKELTVALSTCKDEKELTKLLNAPGELQLKLDSGSVTRFAQGQEPATSAETPAPSLER